MGIADSVWESIEGAQTNKDMQILRLCFGNPTRNTGASTSASTVPPPLALECRQPDGDRLEQGTDGSRAMFFDVTVVARGFCIPILLEDPPKDPPAECHGMP